MIVDVCIRPDPSSITGKGALWNLILKSLYHNKVNSFHQILLKLSQNDYSIMRILSFQIRRDLSSIMGKGAFREFYL